MLWHKQILEASKGNRSLDVENLRKVWKSWVGNTLSDGLPGWFAPTLVTKGDYF